jgi:hypothetical protein
VCPLLRAIERDSFCILHIRTASAVGWVNTAHNNRHSHRTHLRPVPCASQPAASTMSVCVVASVGVRASASKPREPSSQSSAPPSLISNRRQLLRGGLAAGLCLCCPPPLAALAQEAAAPSASSLAASPTILGRAQEVATVADGVGLPPWGYSCLDGPVNWSGVCATTGQQSPINLNYDARFPPAPDRKLSVLAPRFPRFIKAGATVKNSGHGTMQVGGGASVGGIHNGLGTVGGCPHIVA